MQKILITGGAGFIGSHLAEQLLNDQNRVIVVDNFSTGRLENLDHLKQNPNLVIVEADICEDNLSKTMEDVNHLYHLAALADIVPSIQSPEEYYAANVTGTFNVVQAATTASVQSFIYAASSSCYGIPNIYPTPESAEIKPQYPYALTKYLGEQIVLHWAKVYGLPATSLRLFNVFGPRSRTSGTYGAVFGVFCARNSASKPFTVIGDGTQTRDFTFVSDIVCAMIRAAEAGFVGEFLMSEVIIPKVLINLSSYLEAILLTSQNVPANPIAHLLTYRR